MIQIIQFIFLSAPSVGEVLRPVFQPVSMAERYLDRGREILISYGPRLLTSFIVLLLGLWLIRVFMQGFSKLMRIRDVDPTLRPFLRMLISIALRIMLFLSVASMIGLETTSFVAALGAAGLAVGLALQGSLSNFAGGVLILLFKPFRVGDTIEGQGIQGEVQEIQILYTVLITADNKKVVIPNGNLSNNSITNFTSMAKRRIDMRIYSGYENNIRTVKGIIVQVVQSHTTVLKDPVPTIGVLELTESAVVFACHLWVNREDFQRVKLEIQEQIALQFHEQGIVPPIVKLEQQLSSAAAKSRK